MHAADVLQVQGGGCQSGILNPYPQQVEDGRLARCLQIIEAPEQFPQARMADLLGGNLRGCQGNERRIC